MKKNKLILTLLAIFFLFPALAVEAAGKFVYTPMENIPFFGKSSDFCEYISFIYKFGIATVGICALLMIVIGGFMYSTSAGNNAKMETAKKVITEALVGLFLAMIGWLVFYLINPDLTVCKLPEVEAMIQEEKSLVIKTTENDFFQNNL